MPKIIKIGTITPSWNSEKFIIPHLRMITRLTDRNVLLQGTAPWPIYKAEHGLSDTPDSSEQLVKDNFPKVEIHTARINEYRADLYNQGLELLKDMDVVFKLDTDMFLTRKDWTMLIDFVKDNPADCYWLGWKEHCIDYSYDLDHGKRSPEIGEPLAVSPKKRFHNYYDYPVENKIEIDIPIVIHHLRGWKGKGNSLEWVNSQNYDWIKAPKEIKRMIYGINNYGLHKTRQTKDS